MIRSFADKETELVRRGRRRGDCHSTFPGSGLRKCISPPRGLAGGRAAGWWQQLERLGETAKGQWSIRINGRWRSMFFMVDGGARIVEIVINGQEAAGPDRLPHRIRARLCLRSFRSLRACRKMAGEWRRAIRPRMKGCARFGYVRADTEAACAVLGMSEGFYVGLRMVQDRMDRRRALGERINGSGAIEPLQPGLAGEPLDQTDDEALQGSPCSFRE